MIFLGSLLTGCWEKGMFQKLHLCCCVMQMCLLSSLDGNVLTYEVGKEEVVLELATIYGRTDGEDTCSDYAAGPVCLSVPATTRGPIYSFPTYKRNEYNRAKNTV